MRIRIKDHRVVAADLIDHNPKNWRVHTDAQRNLLKGMLNEVGYVADLLVVEKAGGRFQLIDGELRQTLSTGSDVPVAVLDLNEQEQDLVAAFFDRVAEEAGQNVDSYISLLNALQTSDKALLQFIEHEKEQALQFTATTEPPPRLDQTDEDGWKKSVTCPECGHEFKA